jgi:hypothetical protein
MLIRLSDSWWMTPWEVVQQALAHRSPPRDQQWLAEQLDIEAQAITNWKTRGVPPKRFRQLASLFGLTVNQIEGIDPLPWERSVEWPFSVELRARVERMTSEERCSVEKAVWDYLEESTPAVVQEQLKKALANVEKHGLRGLDVNTVTSAGKARPMS